MALNPLNHHYAMENPASVYDEEAMSALELAGRTTAKVNETVQAFNELEHQTNEHLDQQDQTIDTRLTQQDERITTMNNVAMPAKVTQEIQGRIDNGQFDQAINEYAGDLEGRVDNLLGKVVEGTTTMDAEVIDMRTGHGKEYLTAGDALRDMTDAVQRTIPLKFHAKAFATDVSGSEGHLEELTYTTTHTNHLLMFSGDFTPGKRYRVHILTQDGYNVTRVFMNNQPMYNVPEGIVTTTHRKVTTNNLTVIDFSFTNDTENIIYLGVRIDGPANMATSIKMSVIRNVESTPVQVGDLKDVLNGMDSLVPIYKISSHFVSELEYNYHLGTYTPSVEVTPTNVVCGLACHHDLEIGKTYLFKVETEKDISGLWYSTITGWGEGAQFATIQKKTIRTSTGYMFYIRVLENGAGANRIVMRIATPNLEPFTLSCELCHVFHYDFNAGGGETEYIAFCGDSLTAQQYFTYIQTEKTKVGFAVGGESIGYIFPRTGVEPLYVESTSILPGRNPIELSVSGLFQQGMGNINPVTIAGIEGNLELSEGQYYFTPSTEIQETPIYRPLVIPYQAKLNIAQYVFWVGTNNSTWTAEQIFEQWKKILEVYPNSLILGLTNDSTDARLNLLHELDTLGAKLGSRFVPLHDWIVEHGMEYTGLTPTDADTTAMNAGKIPPSLLSDTVHFNEYGKKCVSFRVTEHLKIFNKL